MSTNISCNLGDAAEAILTHSFAIVRLDDTTTQILLKAWTAARNFFASVASLSEQSIAKYRRIVGGHLVGLNHPSDAKVLYRAICTDWGQQYQPWPDDNSDATDFRGVSMDLAERLHKILVSCLKEIRTKLSDENIQLQQTKKRRRLSYDEEQLKRKFPLPMHTNKDLINSTKHSTIKVPETLQEGYICPLDYFLYHGERTITNCTEHVDRGVLICVALTDVQGLECAVRSKKGSNGTGNTVPFFVCPETLSSNENLFQDRQPCSGLVCIMAGDQLRTACSTAEVHYINDWRLDACVHRVRKQLKRARLSITYELRGIV